MNSPHRKVTTLRLTDDFDRKLHELAKERGVSKNALIITLLYEAVSQKVVTG